jgi:hypothetical protein
MSSFRLLMTTVPKRDTDKEFPEMLFRNFLPPPFDSAEKSAIHIFTTGSECSAMLLDNLRIFCESLLNSYDFAFAYFETLVAQTVSRGFAVAPAGDELSSSSVISSCCARRTLHSLQVRLYSWLRLHLLSTKGPPTCEMQCPVRVNAKLLAEYYEMIHYVQNLSRSQLRIVLVCTLSGSNPILISNPGAPRHSRSPTKPVPLYDTAQLLCKSYNTIYKDLVSLCKNEYVLHLHVSPPPAGASRA